jgi:hypothetical protein
LGGGKLSVSRPHIGGLYCVGILIGGGGIGLAYSRRLIGSLLTLCGLLLAGLGAILLGYGWLWGPWSWAAPLLKQDKCEQDDGPRFNHTDTVTQKLLTVPYYCNTLIAIGRANMANVLSIDKQVAIISALAEGSGIRQIERITGVHRDTIMRLGVRVGQGCAGLLDRKMRNLTCEHLQFDEIWGFIGKKERHCTVDDDPQIGDAWTFCAIDSDTKLVPSFKVGKRDSATANAFVRDVASRVNNPCKSLAMPSEPMSKP